MSISVKNIFIDRPTRASASHVYQIERLIISMEDEVDFPFIMGKISDIIDPEFPKQTGVKSRYKIIGQPFANDSGLLKRIVNIGEYGWYFVLLPPGTVFQDLIIQPGDLDIDLYIGDEDNCLLYSFYNSSTNRISVAGKIVQDTRSIYSKIKANMDDLELRQYYLKPCLAKTITRGEFAEPVPDFMNMDEAAGYLGIGVKTLYNWISDEKIPFTKVGRLNKFRKEDLDQYLENRTHKLGTGRGSRKS